MPYTSQCVLCISLNPYNIVVFARPRANKRDLKGPDTLDAIRQRDAIFRFSMTDNFDPIVSIFQIFRSVITFWVIWSTYLLKFALIGCFINFQKLKNGVALSNRVRCVWTLRCRTAKRRRRPKQIHSNK
jgi:hypothetical protein